MTSRPAFCSGDMYAGVPLRISPRTTSSASAARPTIRDPHLTAAIDHYVGRLEIAMQYAALGRSGKTGADAARELERPIGGRLPMRSDARSSIHHRARIGRAECAVSGVHGHWDAGVQELSREMLKPLALAAFRQLLSVNGLLVEVCPMGFRVLPSNSALVSGAEKDCPRLTERRESMKRWLISIEALAWSCWNLKQGILKGNFAPVIAAAFAFAFSGPLYAQRTCSAAASLKVVETVENRTTAAQVEQYAARPPFNVVVNGGGIARLTDPDGEQFSYQFEIGAVLHSDGSAQGRVNFIFPMPFSLKWGALPGVSELIHLWGEITAGVVKPNGDVELSGPFIETDYNRREGIVFREDSRVSGAAPVKIVISGRPGAQQFTLAWCSFIPPAGTGAFLAEVEHGSLKIHR